MKLSFATPTPEIDVPVPVALFSGTLGQRLEKAAHWGYDGVELMVARPSELDAAAIAAEVADHGLEIAAIATGVLGMVEGLTLLSSDADMSRLAEERLRELVDFAAASQAPLVTIGSFRGRVAWVGAGGREQLKNVLRRAAAYAAERGVRLVLETANRYELDLLYRTDEALAFIDEIGSDHVGLLLDTFHVNIEEPSLTECFRAGAAAGRLWHVHLGDSNRLPPGQGHIDFASIVATLREVGYQGYLSAELFPLPDPDTAGEATVRHMRQFVPRQPA